MEQSVLLQFMHAQKWSVAAIVSGENAPQAAVIGVVIADRFEVVFDTVTDARKQSTLGPSTPQRAPLTPSAPIACDLRAPANPCPRAPLHQSPAKPAPRARSRRVYPPGRRRS
jgi:hypothetical protein